MSAQIQVQDGAEWKPFVTMSNGFLAAKAVERLTIAATKRGKPVKYRIIKTEDAERRTQQEEENLLRIADTADEIARVYRNGPYSCFAGSSHSLQEGVRAYAGPDLAVAYLEVQGCIVARAVIWPAKKLYSRIYAGDRFNQFENALKANGYKRGGYYTGPDSHGSFDGARLVKMPNGSHNADTNGNIYMNYYLPCLEHGAPIPRLEGDFIVMRSR